MYTRKVAQPLELELDENLPFSCVLNRLRPGMETGKENVGLFQRGPTYVDETAGAATFDYKTGTGIFRNCGVWFPQNFSFSTVKCRMSRRTYLLVAQVARTP